VGRGGMVTGREGVEGGNRVGKGEGGVDLDICPGALFTAAELKHYILLTAVLFSSRTSSVNTPVGIHVFRTGAQYSSF